MIALVWAVGSRSDRSTTQPEQEILPQLHWAWWIVLWVGFTLLRSSYMMLPSSWPNFDESELAQTALSFDQNQDWKFFYSVGQVPPLFNWLERILFWLFNEPLLNLWFFSGSNFHSHGPIRLPGPPPIFYPYFDPAGHSSLGLKLLACFRPKFQCPSCPVAFLGMRGFCAPGLFTSAPEVFLGDGVGPCPGIMDRSWVFNL